MELDCFDSYSNSIFFQSTNPISIFKVLYLLIASHLLYLSDRISSHLSYSLLISSNEMLLFLFVKVIFWFKVLTFGCTTKKDVARRRFLCLKLVNHYTSQKKRPLSFLRRGLFKPKMVTLLQVIVSIFVTLMAILTLFNSFCLFPYMIALCVIFVPLFVPFVGK